MLAPGFSDPVLASQAVFRTVMEAMARPGSIAAARRRDRAAGAARHRGRRARLDAARFRDAVLARSDARRRARGRRLAQVPHRRAAHRRSGAGGLRLHRGSRGACPASTLSPRQHRISGPLDDPRAGGRDAATMADASVSPAPASRDRAALVRAPAAAGLRRSHGRQPRAVSARRRHRPDLRAAARRAAAVVARASVRSQPGSAA